MPRFSKTTSRKARRQAQRRRINRRQCRFESLETRNLLTVLFADSFEQGANSNDWNGNWVEDSQNDWFRSTQRATDGSHSAEVDGWAHNATLTLSNPINLSGYSSAQLTFDWFIEKGLDGGEYLSLDVSSDGGATWQSDVRRLSGNVDAENTWHSETVDLTPYKSSNTLVRFRGKASRGNEDADVDNVKITGTPTGPPKISISDASIAEDQPLETLVTSGSGGLDNSQFVAIGPDNRLYVGGYLADSVFRYDAATGQFIDVFISSGSGGLSKPQGMAFGPDGSFFVASGATANVLRYDASGTFVGEFVASGVGGLAGPKGLTWGADGNLYVASGSANSILRFDNNGNPLPGPHGASGSAEFVPSASGGLSSPRDISFGPDGRLYVASRNSGDILRYDSTGGQPEAFIPSGTAGLDDPFGLAFAEDGYLYVSRVQADEVLRFDSNTGAFVDTVAGRIDGLDQPADVLVARDGSLLIANRLKDGIARFSSGVVVSLSSPSNQPITVNYASASGTASPADFTALGGVVTFAPNETTKVILVNATDDTDVESSEAFSIDLSNPTGGATLQDSHSVVTITDDDVNRKISISDAVVTEGDHTPHYRGAFVDGLPGGHFNPLTFGPDGFVYTAVGTGAGYNTIQKYDGTTGAFVGTFMDNSDPNHKINGVRDIVFHPTDGKVYVASAYTDEVLRYDATTSAFVDVFVTANSGGIDHPDGMMFGPDANGDGNPELYVTGWLSNSVVRYDGATGAPLGTYVTAGSGGLAFPFSLAFRNNELFVTSADTNQILKYDAANGSYLGAAANTGLNYPRGLTFGPDDLLYVTSGNDDRIVRFTPQGNYVDDFVPAGTGGMQDPRTLRFGPDGDLYVTVTGKNEIMRFGDENEAVFTATLSTPSNAAITVDYATAPVGANPANKGADYLDATGQVLFQSGATQRVITVPILDDTLSEPNETFEMSLSLSAGTAAGAVLLDGQGIGTIVDDGDLGNQPPSANAGADQTVSDSDGNGSEMVTLNGSGSDSDGTIASYAWAEGSTGLGTGASISPTLAVGTHTLTLTVTDDGGAIGSDTVIVTVEAPPAVTRPLVAKGVVQAGSGGWTYVSLAGLGFSNPVIIATPNYDSSLPPMVSRITNVTGSGFDLKVQPADAGATSIANVVDVHYIVVEAGMYTVADNGVKMEARTMVSNKTAENNDWNQYDSVGYLQSYASPVVVGQVMSTNDPDWSSFWASGSSRTSPPSNLTLRLGKQVGEDPDATRAAETIGFVVIEAGSGEIGGLPFVAGLGSDSIKGVGDSPSYDYALSLPSPPTTSYVAAVSQAGMDGGNGGWAVLYGANAVTPTQLQLAIEEDQMKDLERRHTTEQVAYFVIDPPLDGFAPSDTNQDGHTTPFDALLVVNWLNANGSGASTSATAALDVNRDGRLTPADVLWVVNELNGRNAAGEGEAALADDIAARRSIATARALDRIFTDLNDHDPWTVSKDLLDRLV